jgi:hypothetical protein
MGAARNSAVSALPANTQFAPAERAGREGARIVNRIEQDLADAGMRPIDDAEGTRKALGFQSIKQLYVLNERGLPRIRSGRNLRYSRREVAAFLEARRDGEVPASLSA